MNYLLLLMLALLTVGCADKNQKPNPPVETVVVDKSVAYECGVPAEADKFTALDVKWRTVEIEGVRLFALSGPFYENLMKNMTMLASSAAQVGKQRDFYRDCVNRSRAPAPAAPKVEVKEGPRPEQ